MKRRVSKIFLAVVFSAVLLGSINPPKPGWNLFSVEQDVQLGKEARAQVERQMPVVHNSQVNGYLTQIGQRLARSQYAGQYPYTFELVADKAVNAFSLPGGPVFINTGLIANADNRAQLAGVIAHEMSHIALRHATNQASKANLVRLPAILMGAAAGGSMLGSLAQAGIGLGANSVLLKFSRSAEAQADYNGVLMMADAGYNPIELARFFEKLEAQSSHQGALSQFLSDHPNPGNRVQAIEAEIRQLPQRQYTTDSGQFVRIKDLVQHLPARGQLRSDFKDQHPDDPPEIRPVSRFREYNANGYSVRYPENWEAFGDKDSAAVTFAPRDALFQSANGGPAEIGYGAMISYYFPPGDRIDLKRDTAAVISNLSGENPHMKQRDQRTVTVGGQNALLTTLNSQSPYRNETEVDSLVTVPRPEGLFYMVFIAPSSEWSHAEPAFQEMMRSIRFQ
jgi:Zn-dependent protease with chaperone function